MKKEKPILFSGEMIRAILSGKKTQTRRVIKPQPPGKWDKAEFIKHKDSFVAIDFFSSFDRFDHGYLKKSFPYGRPGDHLWVREAFCPDWAGHGPIYRADGGSAVEAGYPKEPRWKPSIHMPRKLSRLTLEVTHIRVQRLREISEQDCWAEGCEIDDSRMGYFKFHELWERINGAESWSANPWVHVIEFKKI